MTTLSWDNNAELALEIMLIIQKKLGMKYSHHINQILKMEC